MVWPLPLEVSPTWDRGWLVHRYSLRYLGMLGDKKLQTSPRYITRLSTENSLYISLP